LDICRFIIREGFRLLKPRGHLFLFCDIEHFLTLRDYGAQQAYTPWRTPVIWRKGDEGQAPWGREGFTRTYEICLFLTKGAKALKGGGADIKDVKRPARNERAHAAEKPVALLSHLLSLSCDPGDTVLDPTCGSGPLLDAATEAKLKAICIEKDPDYHNFAAARLARAAEAPLPQPSELLS
jgi:site-specific DNA-methyltransferase (adenine-specific)